MVFRIDDGFTATFEFGDEQDKTRQVTAAIKADSMAGAFILAQERVNKLGYKHKRILSIGVLDGGIISDD
jgi:hypothetical protein